MNDLEMTFSFHVILGIAVIFFLNWKQSYQNILSKFITIFEWWERILLEHKTTNLFIPFPIDTQEVTICIISIDFLTSLSTEKIYSVIVHNIL